VRTCARPQKDILKACTAFVFPLNGNVNILKNDSREASQNKYGNNDSQVSSNLRGAPPTAYPRRNKTRFIPKFYLFLNKPFRAIVRKIKETAANVTYMALLSACTA
jgi:hypothetical protein